MAGANLAAVTDLRAQQASADATDPTMQIAEASANCLSAPKGATPAGSHWYYRIDRVTKRQCWYLREEGERSDDKFARAATPSSTPAAAETSPAPLPTPRKFSEARAEYVAQASRADAAAPAPTRSIAAATAPADDSRGAMPNVLAPSPLASMRWNEQPASNAPVAANPPPVRMAAAAVPATLQSQPPVEQLQQPSAEPSLAPVATEARPTASVQKLVLVIAAALALAGILASAVVRIGRMRARRAMKRKRSAMWDSSARSSRKKRPAQPAKQPNLHEPDARPRRAAAAHPMRAPQARHAPQERHLQDLSAPDLPVQDQPVREVNVRELNLQDLQLEERPPQDRPPQDRPRQVRERPRLQPESYAPPNRRQVPVDRIPAERAPADRAAADRGPKERAPQQREHQVSEMLSRLARSAQH